MHQNVKVIKYALSKYENIFIMMFVICWVKFRFVTHGASWTMGRGYYDNWSFAGFFIAIHKTWSIKILRRRKHIFTKLSTKEGSNTDNLISVVNLQCFAQTRKYPEKHFTRTFENHNNITSLPRWNVSKICADTSELKT